MITPQIVADHGLDQDEYGRILAALGREPNLVELGIFSVMWSEHCSYKSSRFHLKRLPTEAPWVICGPGENAGVIDIGDNQAAIFKMESHNHPSYIEPYQGAATGVGGILRDVFTMGARPIANLNALRFGRPDHPRMRHLIAGVVAGIGGYGNCVGVPTVGGEVNFDAAYDGNILVNAMTVGVAPQDKIFYSAATGVGNPIVYVGSKTGRDGIHGATMASADFDEHSDDKRPTVQVGDPFTEKLLIEACLELMASDAIVAIQDMGAAGLTSSSVEMASKGGVGIRLDMNAVPCRETGMTPYEMMLSESQERMLMVLKPGREAFAEAIFRKWELDFAVIGEVTDTGHMVLEFDGAVVCDIPLGPLADDAPLYERPYMSRDDYQAWTKVAPIGEAPRSTDIVADLLKLMASPDIASRRWIWEQYDSQVGADTLQRPGGDAAVVRVHGTPKALAMTTDCTPRYCYADPHDGGRQAIAEAYRNLSAVGARPLAVTNCLNFGNPQRPEIMAQITGCLEGMSEACIALDFPIVSGNVSLYNESKATGGGSAILPTPAIGGVGLLDDWSKSATIAFKDGAHKIFMIGGRPTDMDEFGQSLWLRECHGRRDGPPPTVDLPGERKTAEFIRAMIDAGAASAVHDVSDGGPLVAVTEMALAGGIGCRMVKGDPSTPSPCNQLFDESFFAENQGRYIVTQAFDIDLIEPAADEAGIHYCFLGWTGGETIEFQDDELGSRLRNSPSRPPRCPRRFLPRLDVERALARLDFAPSPPDVRGRIGGDINMGRTIALQTAVSGTLDILLAMGLTLFFGRHIGDMLRTVASGPFPAATGMGSSGALLGLVVHFALMAIMAAIFVALVTQRPTLLDTPYRTGVAYGVITYIVMNLIVVQLRFHPPFPPKPISIATQLFAHIVLVGIPFALIAARTLGRPSAA